MTILGIETSCDETATAIVSLASGRLRVHREVVASQAALHAKYGGVVPEVAARKQVEAIIPVLREVKVRPVDIDAIAVTQGPGLVTSLGVGVETAKALSLAWGKPLLGVNHVLAHLYGAWLSHPAIPLPALGLIVSGGHTELVLLKSHHRYQLLGRTMDDAAGECLDKSARLLGLPYPGGAALEKLAAKGKADAAKFPAPLANTKTLDFSYSGLKTAVRYELEKHPATGQRRADVARAIQTAVSELLTRRLDQALVKFKAKSVVIGGGVTANRYIRAQLQLVAGRHRVPLFLPEQKWTGDNAAMIAAAALFQLREKSPKQVKKLQTTWKTLLAEPNWEL